MMKYITKLFTYTVADFFVSVVSISVLALLLGDSAREYSTMFIFGSQALPLATIFQYLLLSLLLAGANLVLFDTPLLAKMMTLWKTVIMLSFVIISIVVFVMLFGWFPVDNPLAWISFLVCFGACFIISTALMVLKTKLETKKVERSLQEFQMKRRNPDE